MDAVVQLRLSVGNRHRGIDHVGGVINQSPIIGTKLIANDILTAPYFDPTVGEVQMPLTKTLFASSFGMLTDRFGVSWMVIVYAGGRDGG